MFFPLKSNHTENSNCGFYFEKKEHVRTRETVGFVSKSALRFERLSILNYFYEQVRIKSEIYNINLKYK